MSEGLSSTTPQTWHHGLVATWWAEFNDDFGPHEIDYFRRYVERGGGAVLDVACGDPGRTADPVPLRNMNEQSRRN